MVVIRLLQKDKFEDIFGIATFSGNILVCCGMKVSSEKFINYRL